MRVLLPLLYTRVRYRDRNTETHYYSPSSSPSLDESTNLTLIHAHLQCLRFSPTHPLVQRNAGGEIIIVIPLATALIDEIWEAWERIAGKMEVQLQVPSSDWLQVGCAKTAVVLMILQFLQVYGLEAQSLTLDQLLPTLGFHQSTGMSCQFAA